MTGGRLSAGVAMLAVALVAAGCGSPSPHDTTTTSRAPATTTTRPHQTTTTTSPRTTTTTRPPHPSGIKVGPGPQSTYTVEAQPAAGSCHYRHIGAYPLPDPRCTPGAISPAVTQADIYSTICVSGYTSSVRPPYRVTSIEKRASARAYGYAGSLHTAEYDHLIPLELGGDPNDPANLWVEPNDRPNARTVYNTKDTLENELHRLVCSGQLSLATARTDIATNWVAAYRRFG